MDVSRELLEDGPRYIGRAMYELAIFTGESTQKFCKY